METTNWSYDEFLCLALIYVSHVDMEYSEDEASRIKSKFSDDVYNKVYSAFDNMSDFESLQVILSFKDKYFANEESKQDLLDAIKIQFFIDGEYSVLEKEIYHFFQKLL